MSVASSVTTASCTTLTMGVGDFKQNLKLPPAAVYCLDSVGEGRHVIPGTSIRATHGREPQKESSKEHMAVTFLQQGICLLGEQPEWPRTAHTTAHDAGMRTANAALDGLPKYVQANIPVLEDMATLAAKLDDGGWSFRTKVIVTEGFGGMNERCWHHIERGMHCSASPASWDRLQNCVRSERAFQQLQQQHQQDQDQAACPFVPGISPHMLHHPPDQLLVNLEAVVAAVLQFQQQQQQQQQQLRQELERCMEDMAQQRSLLEKQLQTDSMYYRTVVKKAKKWLPRLEGVAAKLQAYSNSPGLSSVARVLANPGIALRALQSQPPHSGQYLPMAFTRHLEKKKDLPFEDTPTGEGYAMDGTMEGVPGKEVRGKLFLLYNTALRRLEAVMQGNEWKGACSQVEGLQPTEPAWPHTLAAAGPLWDTLNEEAHQAFFCTSRLMTGHASLTSQGFWYLVEHRALPELWEPRQDLQESKGLLESLLHQWQLMALPDEEFGQRLRAEQAKDPRLDDVLAALTGQFNGDSRHSHTRLSPI
ncbi:hypothetical protein DUNSADRAFT_17849 [Dunaliella salina]|uniref:Uncharacterized protein n=1 Tax=Dunaliella salina TaxID=3046 RepID=A0ABZ3KGI8_DUNSA|nr:hypothetical protein DUNSADRAFT_17849 [Dunaliella salina]|eukprot:KAF5828286.1 hypothetical protein DUNSADRAFT_17849 [Dunaliella salina]